ncbi:DUF2637 domain-containing protein [Gordonia amarae]|uniref:Uncharacterized protein n=2 Tax=Gordonia amarae TaxID=36821 RepID=G7GN49_9ACTN|nr:DUF2637 domain-containing protein [Gordonia amarae]MCS3877248.1 putative membrane protein [Gordonia amarae]QHN20569.1 DUF2637 domain-containing protein [Gordonia amarae]QHN29420.1 DUF2637 domain-containing protein [Gordonia amarae]QHN38218.1 DUF2637 domain-containing protein [Gordonia amarae]GAB05024.1 hypothetical protein GOAMR_25_00610 [Gordonia amarae NBRC 15530]
MRAAKRPAGQPDTYHKGLAWALVLTFTVVSVVLNGLHAVMMQWDGQEGGWFGAVLLAVMAPVSLLLATHLLVGLIQDWTHRRRWLVRLRGVVAGVFAVIGAIAFVMSFAALRDMAERYGMSGGLSWMAPVIIDSVILAGTLAVVIAEAEMRLDREEADAATLSEQRSVDRPVAPYEPVEQRPTAPVEHAVEVVERPDERPDEQVDEQWSTDRATAPYEMDDRSVEQAVEIRSTGPDQAGRVDEHPVDRADEILSDLPVRSDEQMSEQWSTGAVDRPDELDDVVSEQPVDPCDRADERGSTGQDEDSAEAVEWLSEAERVSAATGITAALDDLATVLRMDEAGASRREIAEAVGRPKSTVSGWIAKASSVGADRSALTAVR